MQATKLSNIDREIREKLVAVLNALLSDSIDLSLQAKQAHWNIKGPAFISLHQMFDSVAKDVRTYSDTIAERVAQLGGVAVGTVQAVVFATKLPIYPVSAEDQDTHLDVLSTSLAAFSSRIVSAIEVALLLKDQITANILITIGEGTDKWVWMVQSNLVK